MQSANELVSFVQALTARLAEKKDYELVQAWVNVFLKLHSDAITHDPELVAALKAWKEEQHKEGKRLGELVGYCGGVVGFLRNPRT
jgi:U3 small nucleolar RNA-associated protein 21